MLQYIYFFDSMPIMNIAYISLIFSFLTNIGLMYIILRLLRTGDMRNIGDSKKEAGNSTMDREYTNYSTTENTKDTSMLRTAERANHFSVPTHEGRGESLVHLFSGQDIPATTNTQKQKKFAITSLWKYIPSRQLVAIGALAVIGIVLLALYKKILPGVQTIFSNILSQIENSFLGGYRLSFEPLLISSILMTLLAISLLVHAVQSGKRSLRIGSFMFLLVSMLYGAYVLPNEYVAHILASLITIIAGLFSAHRGSYKKLWLTFIASVLSFAVLFVRFATNVTDTTHSIYLLLVLAVIFGVSMYIAQKQAPFDSEDAFFVASGPVALGFLIQGVVSQEYSYTIGIYLLIAAFVFGLLLYYSRGISDRYRTMAQVALAGIVITGMYSVIPSSWYNSIIALVSLVILYVTASKGKALAYLLYGIGCIAALRLLNLGDISSTSSYFANTVFIAYTGVSLLLLFFAGVLYQNTKQLPYTALTKFAVFFGILAANLIFSVGALSEFSRMRGESLISSSDFVLISLVGLILHGIILISISIFRKTRGLFIIGALLIFAGFAKFYIVDVELVEKDMFSLITLGGVSAIILLIVLFPDYRKYVP